MCGRFKLSDWGIATRLVVISQWLVVIVLVDLLGVKYLANRSIIGVLFGKKL